MLHIFANIWCCHFFDFSYGHGKSPSAKVCTLNHCLILLGPFFYLTQDTVTLIDTYLLLLLDCKHVLGGDSERKHYFKEEHHFLPDYNIKLKSENIPKAELQKKKSYNTCDN